MEKKLYLVYLEEWDDNNIVDKEVVRIFDTPEKAKEYCDNFESALVFINKDLNSADEYIMLIREQVIF